MKNQYILSEEFINNLTEELATSLYKYWLSKISIFLTMGFMFFVNSLIYLFINGNPSLVSFSILVSIMILSFLIYFLLIRKYNYKYCYKISKEYFDELVFNAKVRSEIDFIEQDIQ